MKFIARSLLILLVLYGLVFALGDALLTRYKAPLWFAIAFAVGLIGIQYLAGPWLIEWLMDIVWDDDGLHISEVHRSFVRQLCAARGLKAPRLGIIYSGTPNAFSFGHTPGDARVVITQGLLDILTPEEVNSVLAHELGHVEHWDFAVMATAALAPLLLYQVYVFGRGNNNTRAVAWAAYLCYLVSQFIVLLLNRTREYMADHYAARVTGEPNRLSSALVKIACGLVRARGEYQEQMLFKTSDKKELRRTQRLEGALSVMGISNVQSGAALALGGANPADAALVMQWDLVNPWARVYELNSTHPLTAFRVRALNDDAAALHQSVEYPLPERQNIAWGLFPWEVSLWAAPFITGALLLFNWGLNRFGIGATQRSVAELLMATGALWVIRAWYRYRGEFEPATVGALIRDTEVSQMRPRAVRVQGEIIGRGVPGAFWSPDLVLRDATGLLFVLYRQSIPFARLLFAIKSADELVGQKVEIEGWFRRGLRPYIEMSNLKTEQGITKRAWSRHVQCLLALAVFAVGCWFLQ